MDVTALSKDDDEPLTVHDLFKGSQLLMDYKKKSWAVTVMSVNGKTHSNGMTILFGLCDYYFSDLQLESLYYGEGNFKFAKLGRQDVIVSR